MVLGRLCVFSSAACMVKLGTCLILLPNKQKCTSYYYRLGPAFFLVFSTLCIHVGVGGWGMWGSFLLRLSGGVAVSGVGERSFSFMKLWW